MYMSKRQQQVEELQQQWKEENRWNGIERPYSAEDVVKLRGSVIIEQTLARKGSERLWKSLHQEDFINALGALTGNQAVQQVKAGLQAIYLSGWQVAADANLSGLGLLVLVDCLLHFVMVVKGTFREPLNRHAT